MPITVKEARRSRSRTHETEEREFIAWGSNDPDAIETAVLAFDGTIAPLGTYVITSYSQEPREDDESVFDCRVGYGKREETETGGNDLSFELSMVTQHVQQSLETVATFGTNPPNFNQGIGFDGEKFTGTDIQVPVFSFRETHYRPIANVDTTYINQLMLCASRPINGDSFRGFSAGECMFLGASGSKRNVDDFAITYAFAASPNLSGLSVGDITSIQKKGWEWLWVLYEKEEDLVAKFITEKPRAAYVERTYESSSFATLLEI